MDAILFQDPDWGLSNEFEDSAASEYGSWTFRDYTSPLFDLLNCPNCGAQGRLCYGCPSSYNTITDLFSGQESAATPLPERGNRHAARPLQFQEMESSSGAGTLTAASLPQNPYTQHASQGMTATDMEDSNAGEVTGLGLSLLDPSNAIQHSGPSSANNVGTTAEHDELNGPDGEAARALNSLANWTTDLPNGDHSQILDYDSMQGANDPTYENGSLAGHGDLSLHGVVEGQHSQEVLDTFERDPQNAKAYAKLVFADGDLFITTHDVMLGRNTERFEQMKRRKKQERRAREELDTYRKEPSQPSQPGDEDQQGEPSNSSQSLEGRPAPPSNFSEHGGPVWYPPHSDGEVEMQRTKPKRRISHFSKSSSTTSVAPANLHLTTMSDLPSPYNEPEARTFAFIPIHTRVPEDISKISKEHLMFSFNFQTEQWELKVIGNRAFVNEELFEKGTVVHLQHNDEIIIATVHMVFKLPDNFRQSPGLSRGTFSKHSEDEDVSEDDSDLEARAVSTSPVRRLSNAMDIESSESEEETEQQEIAEKRPGKRPKLKLQTKTSKGKSKAEKAAAKKALKKQVGKKSKSKDDVEEQSPKASKKVERAKKGKTVEDEGAKDEKVDAASPPAAPYIKPGSALEGIPLEELPEKRKGPGRPPKEGNVSKRDTALANKKRKEFEKMGKEPPSFKDLVSLVRRENKAKEMQARLVASGQLQPADVVQSIEPEAGSSTVGGIGDATANEAARRSPPRPKRNVKALSPVKPLEDCTEEDLKRPDQTYVHILDEILRNHPGDGADLPDIYARMEKRYPYYKYKCPTNGWQSSVRHNLQQSPRFKEAGKAGKGKLWTIDYDSPLEKEKKRKATPPKQPMHNGQFMPGQMQHPPYGQGQYGHPFGQHMPNGQQLGPPGTYYSPYNQQGQHGQFSGHGTLHPPAYPARQPPHTQAQTNGVAPQFKAVVDELLLFNNRHLAAYASNPEEHERQKFLLNAVMEYISAYFHSSEPTDDTRQKVATNPTAARPIYEQLEPLFRKHQPGLVVRNPFEEPVAQVKREDGQTDIASVPAAEPGADAINIDSAHQSPNAVGAAASAAALSNEAGVTAIAEQGGSGPPPTDLEERGTKRGADNAESEPEAKRPRSGEA